VSNCRTAKVPPGDAAEPPKVARITLAAPEIVPVVLMEVEMCAPLIVPAVAAPAPVTIEKKRAVSPEPVEVKVNLLLIRRVSPVVAEVVANAELMFCAVVTARGEDTVPVEKPFCDTTGPENVVVAMMVPYIQVKCISLYVVSRDCLMHRIGPDYCVYITVFSSVQHLFFLSQLISIIEA